MGSALSMISLAAFLVAAFLGWIAWSSYRSESQILSWPTVPGRIAQIGVERRLEPVQSAAASSSMQMNWALALSYEYEVAGVPLVGSTFSNRAVKERAVEGRQPGAKLTDIIRRYPAGSAVAVRYRPDDPSRSYIEVDTSASWLFGVAAVVAALVALAALAVRLAG